GARSAQSERDLPAVAADHTHALRHRPALRDAMGYTATTSQPQANTRPAVAVILSISAAATLFLFWLIYEHPAADASSVRLPFLPALNALLNGLSATALLIGYIFIRARQIAAHRLSMITAFIFSTLFLGSYILHHYLHGDVRYPIHAA